MPFSLTGAPATFSYVIADKLGDLLAKLEIELLIDDGGMVGDNFEGMMTCTHLFFERIHKTCLSLSAKNLSFL